MIACLHSATRQQSVGAAVTINTAINLPDTYKYLHKLYIATYIITYINIFINTYINIIINTYIHILIIYPIMVIERGGTCLIVFTYLFAARMIAQGLWRSHWPILEMPRPANLTRNKDLKLGIGIARLFFGMALNAFWKRAINMV